MILHHSYRDICPARSLCIHRIPQYCYRVHGKDDPRATIVVTVLHEVDFESIPVTASAVTSVVLDIMILIAVQGTVITSWERIYVKNALLC